MTANITELIIGSQTRLNALGDGRDCKSDNEKATYRHDYDTIQRVIGGLQNAPDDLARAEARLADVESRRNVVAEKQREIEREIAAFTDPHALTDARERDREIERQRQVRRQLERLIEGSLFCAPGETYPRLRDLDVRIAELTTRRDQAQSALKSHIAAAERLLSATVTSI